MCIRDSVPVDGFRPDRSQRRCLARNADIGARIVAPVRTDEHLALYRKYLASRHAGGGMDDHGANEFDQFLVGSWNEGRFLELREHGTHKPVSYTHLDVYKRQVPAVATPKPAPRAADIIPQSAEGLSGCRACLLYPTRCVYGTGIGPP